jgi:uridine monophosphate synthetase
MAGFFTRLAARIQAIDSPLCVGLDPHPADLRPLGLPTAQTARDFCLRLIEATADCAAAYKPNAAFFEAFGAEGWAALAEVIAAARKAAPVVLDAKRGDIASTAEAYARAVFETLGADAVTLNPYLGRDSLAPFLADAQRGVFLLCKTSNPGAADLQDLALAGTLRQAQDAAQTVWEKVAALTAAWNEHDNLGLVVGATYPDALRRVREIAPDLWILAPGVGAQGGELAAALHAGLRSDGLGLLIPVSRAISRADDPRRAARELAAEMRNISAARFAPASHPVEADGRPKAPLQLADALLEAGCVRFGEFTLKSGLRSPIYLDLRQLISAPGLLSQVASAYVARLHELKFDRLAALPYAALPIGTAISLRGGWPMIYPRKEAKEYGTAATIEGAFAAGERAVVIDDLATTGGSKFEAIDKLKAAGLAVEDVVVLIDRQSGAAEALAEAGYRLHAVFTLSELLDHWEQTGRVPAGQIAVARAFLQNK